MAYQEKNRRKILLLLLMGFLAFSLVIVDIYHGFGALSFLGTNVASQQPELAGVVLKMRLTRTLTATLVGASLGLAGLCMQNMLKNPIATPFTLGLSSAASFGASLSILSGFPFVFGQANVQASAIFFCFLGSAVILLIFSAGQVSMNTIILVGTAINLFFTSLQELSKYFASERNAQRMTTWSLGDLSKSSWDSVLVVFIVLYIVLVLIYRQSWEMNLLQLSDESAQSMGVNVKRTRLLIFFASALVTAVAISFVGTIGFIGLIAPHFVKVLVGNDARFTIIGSAIMGIVVLLLAAIVSKALIPGTIIPVGIITSLVGVPFMCLVAIRKGQRS
ncbi:iron ABC transporter permease [Fructobacillus cardui]|jgi:iron complex transport system permease protein|uniref:Permease component (FepD) n=1 Tax=Fructobacillus cardui TaxID=2893170 RepID=A0ABM9MYE4_9LACO|nr:iron ABC transporter permease [uncultured Fructobacillus sp.]CAK1221686.1 ABC-type Fe3+-siderophore transport system [Fructobacillus cardui]CAK1249032.1 ABC-type Fe3+-siderophore transport system [Fructobacillus cardui]CAK1250144.1 ABC-type Fe3+-siderophore transport system [Fructobacillus cardui]